MMGVEHRRCSRPHLKLELSITDESLSEQQCNSLNRGVPLFSVPLLK